MKNKSNSNSYQICKKLVLNTTYPGIKFDAVLINYLDKLDREKLMNVRLYE